MPHFYKIEILCRFRIIITSNFAVRIRFAPPCKTNISPYQVLGLYHFDSDNSLETEIGNVTVLNLIIVISLPVCSVMVRTFKKNFVR